MSKKLVLLGLTAAGFAFHGQRAIAQARETEVLDPVTVIGNREDLQGKAGAASEGVVGASRLSVRPLLRAGDIMESVPGLVATQHSGEGKANQYFLRGFNLDHGTDFATYVDNVPVNMPTHAHGQGYTDMYFLIPELLESIHYRKGPYYAQDGDFSSAGSARLRTINKVNQPFAQVEIGQDGYRRGLGVGSLPLGQGNWLLAAEVVSDDGPWSVPQQLKKYNIVSKYSQGSRANGWSIGLNSYQAHWTATDQVPERAITSGALSRFGSLDPTSGGSTRRLALNTQWNQTDDQGATQVSAWALRYQFDLFSNFTYFTRGCDAAPLPTDCDANAALDQFQQSDRRTAAGLSAHHERTLTLAGKPATFKVGTDLRQDAISRIGLYETTARAITGTVRQDALTLNAAGLWSDLDVSITPQLKAVAGMRFEYRGTHSQSAQLSTPKLSLSYSPSQDLDLHANWGQGFHSNDARASAGLATSSDLLVKTSGGEIGTRFKWTNDATITAALWYLRLNSELVFVGDAGTTEPTRPSKRAGIEITGQWRINRSLLVDADVSRTRSRFDSEPAAGNFIPGALSTVVGIGASYASGPWTAGLRLRHIGPRPLTEDNALRAQASTTVNTKLAYRLHKHWQASLEVFNLFDKKGNDIEYAYASRLPGEAPFSEATTPATKHIHPALGRSVRFGLKASF
jgi:outer membrane cobalamin receptor